MGGVGEWKSPGTALDPPTGPDTLYLLQRRYNIKDVKSESFDFLKLVNKCRC